MPSSGCSSLHGVNPNLKKKKMLFKPDDLWESSEDYNIFHFVS